MSETGNESLMRFGDFQQTLLRSLCSLQCTLSVSTEPLDLFHLLSKTTNGILTGIVQLDPVGRRRDAKVREVLGLRDAERRTSVQEDPYVLVF